jgi:Ni/Co efflux regulator RcnB
MRLLSTAALALALAAGGSAAVADPQNNGEPNGHHDHQGGGDRGQRGGNGGGQPQGRVQGQQFNRGQGGQQFRHFEGAQGAQQWQGGEHRFQGQNGQWQGGERRFQGPNQALEGGEQHRRFEGGAVAGPPFNGGPNAGVADRHLPGAPFVEQQRNGGRQGQWRGGDQFGFREHGLRDRDAGRSWFRSGEFRPRFEAQRRFHVGFFARPGGWYYRSWAYGMFLPWGWFTPDFYLDWAAYGLPPPPIGCEWIRQGPDAVLVDVWTGEVLSVYSGLFYW